MGNRHAAANARRAKRLPFQDRCENSLTLGHLEVSGLNEMVEDGSNRLRFGTDRSTGNGKPAKSIDPFQAGSLVEPQQTTAVRAWGIVNGIGGFDHHRLATNRAAMWLALGRSCRWIHCSAVPKPLDNDIR